MTVQDTKEGRYDSEKFFQTTIKKSLRVVIGLVVLALIVFGVSIFRYFSKIGSLEDNQGTVLPQISSHTLRPSWTDVPGTSTANVYNAFDSYLTLRNEKENIAYKLSTYRLPFDVFLRHLYLPSLNIWKDPFTDTIAMDLMGENFLSTNPYTDIALINQRTDFFKNMGSGIYNDISSIVVNDVVEDGDLFYVPVKVSFVAPTRRAFLFLLDKLSLTSDRNNIMLVNEFFYHFWDVVGSLDTVDQDVGSLLSDMGLDIAITKENRDKMLGYVLMQWKKGVLEDVPFLTNDVMKEVIRKASGCRASDSRELCEFLFREKFRTIPRIAYGMGYANVKSSDFLYFFGSVPPLLVMDDFTFAKVKNEETGGDYVYEGSVDLKVYGQGIKTEEVDEIARMLGAECFQDDEKVFSVSDALEVVSDSIVNRNNVGALSAKRSKDLLELKQLLTNVVDEYDALSSYKKMIKLFEVYRMLDDALLCK